MAASVAAAWAMTTGWVRNVGHVTPGPTSPLVRSATAAMNAHTNAALPCCGTHGCRWSAAMTPEKPFCSASTQ